MARHSTGSDLAFYRSLAGWLAPWFLIATISVAAVWIAVSALAGKELETRPPDDQRAPAAASTATVTPAASPSPTPATTRSPKANKSPKPEPAKTQAPLITDGITVQILNGTGVADANDRMADRLDALGFTIVNLEGANRAYSQTTVFWSFPEAQAAATALAERFGWTAAPKPANLSTDVDLHVVVGADEA